MRTVTAFTLLAAAALGVLGACERDPISPSFAAGGNKPGNSVNASRCQNYQDWYTRDGQPFASASDCTAYAAKKGAQLINQAALGCLNGGWESLGSSSGMFTSEQECVDYAVGGGTLVTYADVSIADEGGTLGCTTPWTTDNCSSIHLRIYNAGPAAVTVSWSLSGTYQRTDPSYTLMIPPIDGANGSCSSTDDGLGTWTAACTGVSVPAGGSAFLAHIIARVGATQAGTASITSSSLPDPDSSNDSYTWNFTAPTGS
jgi:hypothetical protein